MFLWQLSVPQKEVVRYLMFPAAITHGHAIYRVAVGTPVYLTIFTSMFMHANILHIAGNMLYLWIFGDNVEDMLGHFRFLSFYLLCGVIAAGAQIAMAPNSTVPSLGASGAIAGVLGAYFVTHGGAKVLCLVTLLFFWTFVWLPAWLVLGGWFVLQLFSQSAQAASGQMGGVAYMAHIGGFLAGALLFYLVGGRNNQKAPVSRDGWGHRENYWG
jgi:membrane associated rhomboid family serine protease